VKKFHPSHLLVAPGCGSGFRLSGLAASRSGDVVARDLSGTGRVDHSGRNYGPVSLHHICYILIAAHIWCCSAWVVTTPTRHVAPFRLAPPDFRMAPPIITIGSAIFFSRIRSCDDYARSFPAPESHNRTGWLPFLVGSVCLAISALYELVEWVTALIGGSGAAAFSRHAG